MVLAVWNLELDFSCQTQRCSGSWCMLCREWAGVWEARVGWAYLSPTNWKMLSIVIPMILESLHYLHPVSGSGSLFGQEFPSPFALSGEFPTEWTYNKSFCFSSAMQCCARFPAKMDNWGRKNWVCAHARCCVTQTESLTSLELQFHLHADAKGFLLVWWAVKKTPANLSRTHLGTFDQRKNDCIALSQYFTWSSCMWCSIFIYSSFPLQFVPHSWIFFSTRHLGQFEFILKCWLVSYFSHFWGYIPDKKPLGQAMAYVGSHFREGYYSPYGRGRCSSRSIKCLATWCLQSASRERWMLVLIHLIPCKLPAHGIRVLRFKMDLPPSNNPI